MKPGVCLCIKILEEGEKATGAQELRAILLRYEETTAEKQKQESMEK